MKINIELNTELDSAEWEIVRNLKAYVSFHYILKEMHATNYLNLTPLNQEEQVLVDELQRILNTLKAKGTTV